MNRLKCNMLIINFLAVILSLGSLVPLVGQTLPSEDRLSGANVEAAFDPQRKVIQQCSAVLYDGRRSCQYGVVMSSDGYILTKWSEYKELKNPRVRVGEKLYQEPQLIGQDVAWDVALIKVAAEGLVSADLAAESELEQGSWVIMNGSTTRKQRRINAGIVSANMRAIEGRLPVVLGLALGRPAAKQEDQAAGVEVLGVLPEGGAAKAGLKKKDRITVFLGKPVQRHEEILEMLKGKQPGDIVGLDYVRGGKIFSTKIELQERKGSKKPQSRNDAMSGDYSARRDSFPKVMQIDIALMTRQTGGPVLGLDGRCVGMCIARANRAETYVIPSSELGTIYKNLSKKP